MAMSCPEDSILHSNVPKTQVAICPISDGYDPRTHNGYIHTSSDYDKTFWKWGATAHLSTGCFCSLNWEALARMAMGSRVAAGRMLY